MWLIKLPIVVMLLRAVSCLETSNSEVDDFAEYIAKTSQLTPSLKQGTGDFDEHDEGDVISDNAWEESGKFEGDLILNERQRQMIVKNVAEQGLARNGVIDVTKRWPDNEVIVAIQVEHFSHDQVQAIIDGMDELSNASCVKFRPYKKGDRDAVVIQGNRKGCFSQVGYQGGFQGLNLHSRHPVGRGCFRHGTVVHELLHSLGFYHMQSSPDRDDYVDIIWKNIIKSTRHNFRKYSTFSVSDFGVGYDYDSVLHYSRNAFTINGKATIVPKQRGAEIGQRNGLSDKDTKKLNKMYCDDDANSKQSIKNSTEKSKKKSRKNKPFDGHGLGYHQGEAMVFKILPETETYKLVKLHNTHEFSDFNKRPLVPENVDNKKIENVHKPPIPLYKQYEVQEHVNDNEKGFELKEMKPKDILHEPHEIQENPIYIESLDRLSKIIKTHVYPSYNPDLLIYKMSGHFLENKDKGEIEKDNDYLSLKPNQNSNSKQITKPDNEERSKYLGITIPEYKERGREYIEEFYMRYPGVKNLKIYSSIKADLGEPSLDNDDWSQQFKSHTLKPIRDNRQGVRDFSRYRLKDHDVDRFNTYYRHH